jgi:HPt (histidine-containing phosphotransfer) domain-containing protein
MVRDAEAGTPGKLREAAQREDWQTLHFLAHSVKGMAGNILAQDLHRQAMEADMAAREGRTEAAQLCLALAGALESLLQEVAHYLSSADT